MDYGSLILMFEKQVCPSHHFASAVHQYNGVFLRIDTMVCNPSHVGSSQTEILIHTNAYTHYIIKLLLKNYNYIHNFFNMRDTGQRDRVKTDKINQL